MDDFVKVAKTSDLVEDDIMLVEVGDERGYVVGRRGIRSAPATLVVAVHFEGIVDEAGQVVEVIVEPGTAM